MGADRRPQIWERRDGVGLGLTGVGWAARGRAKKADKRTSESVRVMGVMEVPLAGRRRLARLHASCVGVSLKGR